MTLLLLEHVGNYVDLALLLDGEINRQEFFYCFDVCCQVGGQFVGCEAAFNFAGPRFAVFGGMGINGHID